MPPSFPPRSQAVHAQVDDRAVQRRGIGDQFNQQRLLHSLGHASHRAGIAPAVKQHVDHVPVAELVRQTAPDAALLPDVKPSIPHLPVRDFEMLARGLQQGLFCASYPSLSGVCLVL